MEECLRLEKLQLNEWLKDKKKFQVEITEQRKLVKRLYDKLHRYKVDARLVIPSNLWYLLQLEECTVIQKKWLLFYTCNHGSWVDACDKTNTQIKVYKEWSNPKTSSLSNKKFQQAKQEIDEAFLDMAEQKLKELAASRSNPALRMFLENNHNSYKKGVKDEGLSPEVIETAGKNAYDALSKRKKNLALKNLMLDERKTEG